MFEFSSVMTVPHEYGSEERHRLAVIADEAYAASFGCPRTGTPPGWDGEFERRGAKAALIRLAVDEAQDRLAAVPRTDQLVAAGRALAARAGARRWRVRARLLALGHEVRAGMAQRRAAERALAIARALEDRFAAPDVA